MSSDGDTFTSTTLITSSLAAFITGFGLGLYSIRGYLIPPSLWSQRAQNLADAPESDESEIDEDDSILDHAPNWANGAEADRQQGLRVRKKNQKSSDEDDWEDVKGEKEKEMPKKQNKRKEAEAANPRQPVAAGGNPNEECKLVLVNILTRWERLGQAKVALKANSEDELLTLMGIARSLGITAEVIQDAGRTQIDPGSITVLGVGPAPKSLVDQVTGGLKLL
ncbi:PTH2-domain-containing protein [Xylariaceae sp. FL0255]|nr:PTH2-domain-containing protein [Xylariaceae sp. FL0255]